MSPVIKAWILGNNSLQCMDELVEVSLSTNKKDNQDQDVGSHRLKNT